MTPATLVLLPLISFAAFFLKALTGFGPAIVVIALGSLFLAPRAVIPTSSVLDLIAGALLLRVDWKPRSYRYWAPLAAAIVIGSVLGSIALRVIDPHVFRLVLAIAILLLGIWFLVARGRTRPDRLATEVPPRSRAVDRAVTFAGGLCGGLVGISGPPIIWHFGRRFAKGAFRQILVPVFFIAAIARTGSYAALGLIDTHVLTYIAIALPGLLAGILIGNRVFVRLPEAVFSRVVGAVLVVVAMRMLL